MATPQTKRRLPKESRDRTGQAKYKILAHVQRKEARQKELFPLPTVP
jgi:hypothetical protein